MKFLLATKKEMTQFFDDEGRVEPATVLSVAPQRITQVKTNEKDGYHALQIGAGKRRKVNKAQAGHFKGDVPRFVREVRVPAADTNDTAVGTMLPVTTFAEGDSVRIIGTSKGKGFQGVVKRHNFSGGPRTHGQRHTERAPGSIGATGPARVFKGKKMAGRMGGDRVTLKNVRVIAIDADAGELVVSGAVPGRRGTLIEVHGT